MPPDGKKGSAFALHGETFLYFRKRAQGGGIAIRRWQKKAPEGRGYVRKQLLSSAFVISRND